MLLFQVAIVSPIYSIGVYQVGALGVNSYVNKIQVIDLIFNIKMMYCIQTYNEFAFVLNHIMFYSV